MASLRDSRLSAVPALVMLIFALQWLYGCDRDGAVPVIDFTDRVRVGKPETSGDRKALRVAVAAMVSPKESFLYYRELLDYLGRRLGRGVRLIQRKTYGQVNELLRKGAIDIAFICSGPYAARGKELGLELLAAPEIDGSHFYRSYLIVNRSSPYETLSDLRGKTFAFTDPASNTGRLVPLLWLDLMGEKPETFFEKTIFTYGHDNSITAVAKGLVDGAAVDGLIWGHFKRAGRGIASKTRIIRMSRRFGIPPVVASPHLSGDLKDRIREILLTAHEDAEGLRILDGLNIDRFVEPREEWYDAIRKMLARLGNGQGPSRIYEKP